MTTIHDDTINTPNLPIPAGATADEWMIPTDFPEDVVRCLNWTNHDTARIGVSVEGMQFGDGHLDRHVSLYNKSTRDDFDLSADDARQLAAKLLEAADALDKVTGTAPPF